MQSSKCGKASTFGRTSSSNFTVREPSTIHGDFRSSYAHGFGCGFHAATGLATPIIATDPSADPHGRVQKCPSNVTGSQTLRSRRLARRPAQRCPFLRSPKPTGLSPVLRSLADPDQESASNSTPASGVTLVALWAPLHPLSIRILDQRLFGTLWKV